MRLKLLAALLLCSACISSAFAQSKPVQRFDRFSKATGQEYELYVSLPAGYNDQDSVKYPVLYVLDGNFMFPLMHTMYNLLNETYAVQDVIIVGIGYHVNSIMGSMPLRTPDMTPTKDTAFEQMFLKELQLKVQTGAADKFLTALKTDIFPFIEKQYKTRGRGLAGHSFGALFGSYVMFREPALFEKYLLSSISLPWDNQHILRMEQDYYQAGNRTLKGQFFVTIGSEETGEDMLALTQKFVAALKTHQYQGLLLESRVLPNETHPSAFLTAFNQGLRVLYKR